MKAKLLNLFLDVHRFTSLAITDTLLHDEAYMELIAEVLFRDLPILRK